MKTGIQLIQEERERQTSIKGWTADHDDSHINGELRDAAISYLMYCDPKAGEDAVSVWPFEISSFKPSVGEYHNLIKAGALIAAEIDRLQRIEAMNLPDDGTRKSALAGLSNIGPK